MSDTTGDIRFPRLPLYGAVALVAVALTAVTLVRVTDANAPPALAASVVERSLNFKDRADGGIDVIDAQNQRVLEVVAPGTNGFLRSTLRGLARERMRRSIGPEAPFRLVARSDGRLTLEDPATGRHVDLEAFGPANSGAFARLLVSRGTPS